MRSTKPREQRGRAAAEVVAAQRSARRRARAASPGGRRRVDRRRRTGRARPRAPRRAAAGAQKPCAVETAQLLVAAGRAASSSARAQRVGRAAGVSGERRGSRSGASALRDEPGEALDEHVRLAGARRPPSDQQRAAGWVTASRCCGVSRRGATGTLQGYGADEPPDSARHADWLGACRRAAAQARAILADAPDDGRARGRDRHDAARAATARWSSTRRPRTRSSPSSTRCTARATLHARSPRSAARSTSASAEIRVVIDPIDGSLNAKRGLPAPRALDRGRRRADDGRRRLRLRLRLRAERGVVGAARRGRAGSTASRCSTRAGRAPQRRRPPRGRGDRVGRPALAAPPADGSARSPAACAPSARSPSRCARSPPARVDGMVSLWRCRAVDAAAAQLIVREAGGLVAFPALRRPARRAAGPRAALAGRGARRTAEALARSSRAVPGWRRCGVADDRLVARPARSRARRRRADRAERPAARRPRRAGRRRRAARRRLHRPAAARRRCRRPRRSTAPQWTDANLAACATILDPVADKLGRRRSGPLRRAAARRRRARSLAAEVGGPDRPAGPARARPVRARPARPRAPAAAALRRAQPARGGRASSTPTPTQLVRWVALHEVTHAVQFAGVPWLRDAPRRRCCASCSARRATSTSTGALAQHARRRDDLAARSSQPLREDGLVDAGRRARAAAIARPPAGDDGGGRGPRRARDGRRRARRPARPRPPARRAGPPPARTRTGRCGSCSSGCSAWR